MRERPILFSGPMVRAIQEGRKTQTRRVVKPQPNGVKQLWHSGFDNCKGTVATNFPLSCHCPYGEQGDRLWVRETWTKGVGLIYRADWEVEVPSRIDLKGLWKPSIHMPRKYSRITLEVISVHTQTLQDISEEDARAEGVIPVDYTGIEHPDYPTMSSSAYRFAFQDIWKTINGTESWDANPLVWVIEFRRVKP